MHVFSIARGLVSLKACHHSPAKACNIMCTVRKNAWAVSVNIITQGLLYLATSTYIVCKRTIACLNVLYVYVKVCTIYIYIYINFGRDAGWYMRNLISYSINPIARLADMQIIADGRRRRLELHYEWRLVTVVGARASRCRQMASRSRDYSQYVSLNVAPHTSSSV